MKNFFKRFRSLLVSASPFAVALLFLSNLIVSFFVYRSSRPQALYRFFVVTNYVHSVSTNLPSSPSSHSLSLNLAAPRESRLPDQVSVDYLYFVLSGRPCVRMYGKIYSEGDYCSRGLILRIYPDRILLWDGTYLENSNSHSINSLERKKDGFRTAL